MESSIWVVQPQAGKSVFKLNGTQSVFLQVPGFKELQAFLHRQAFLQTLVESRRKQLAPASAGCQPWSEVGRGGREGLLRG